MAVKIYWQHGSKNILAKRWDIFNVSPLCVIIVIDHCVIYSNDYEYIRNEFN